MMGTCVDSEDALAFHPGYSIAEIVEASGLTQADHAKRLGCAPETLSLLIRGRLRLSADMAAKLSGELGTTVRYWLNLQAADDTVFVQAASVEE